MGSWTGEALSSAVLVILAIWQMHRGDKKDRDKVVKAIQERDTKLGLLLNEYPPHCHTDKGKENCLTIEGIKYPHSRFGDSE